MIPVLMLASSLLASSPPEVSAVDPRLAERLDRQTAAAVGAFIDSVALAGIPAEPLVQRALQGAMKKAPGQRILLAVRDYAMELRKSREAIGGSSRVQEIIAGASAIHAGVTPGDLRNLRGRRSANLTVALAVLTDLVASGVPVTTAVQAMQVAQDKRASDGDMMTLRNNIINDIRAGASPAAAANVRAHGLAGRKPAPAVPALKSRPPVEPPGKTNGRNR